MDPLPTHLPETGNKDASTHPAETVTSTRDGINHALEYSSAPMPLREEFNSSRAALSQLVKPTNDKDIVLSALIQGLEILCNDGRYNDSVIISLDKLGNSDAIIDWVKKHLENFPAAPLIFCYSREHDVLLPLLKSLGNIIYYPNVRFFDYAWSLLSPPAETWNNPFTVFRGPQYHKKWKIETTRNLLGIIEHQLWKHRKIDVSTIDESIIADCLDQIENARKVWIKWDDRAVLEQIITVNINWDETSVQLPQISFNMTCVDWDNTLMRNGVFQEDIWTQALSIAVSNNQTLVVWTWGGPETLMQIQDFFKHRGQPVMTCAKQDCEWWIIGYAVDDETGPELHQKYGFTVSNLIPVL